MNEVTTEKDKLLQQFSPHVFWDIDRCKIDFIENKKFIIERVLEYGLMNDWNLIKKIYTLNEISDTAISARCLDKKTTAFISLLANVPKESFRCYTSIPLPQQHWNF